METYVPPPTVKKKGRPPLSEEEKERRRAERQQSRIETHKKRSQPREKKKKDYPGKEIFEQIVSREGARRIPQIFGIPLTKMPKEDLARLAIHMHESMLRLIMIHAEERRILLGLEKR